MNYYIDYFGQAYGEGNYGAGTYSCTADQERQGLCTVAGGSNGDSAGSGSGGLADTGIGIIAVATLACVIIFVALIVRVWRRKPAAQSAVVSPTSTDSTIDKS